MTLLFYLRSPAGNTDTAQAPDGAVLWEHEKLERAVKKKKSKKDRLKVLSAAEAAHAESKRRKRRSDEEILIMFMGELYED